MATIPPKEKAKIHLILLSGGSGTRLWPLSNSLRSKQFLKVLRDEDGNHISMVQRVFAQINKVPAILDITIATGASQQTSIERQLSGEYTLVLEPERRDTAPAIMLACANLATEQGAAYNDTVVVMPIDTYADQAYYDCIVELDAAVQARVADLVLLGVEPTYPTEKYGYIMPRYGEGIAQPVDSFKEKPDAVTVGHLIKQGALWNCGVFAFQLGYLQRMTRNYCTLCNYTDLIEEYRNLPKNSFDYEIVEKSKSIAVISYSGTWKDLGTWNTLTEEMVDECAGRVFMDRASCKNVHVINETGIPMIVTGLKDAVVVATPDGILASGKETSAGIKNLLPATVESRPMYERRYWGEYRVFDYSVFPNDNKALTKELVIENGKQISYQRHEKRSEVWTIVSGKGEVVLDEVIQEVGAGSVVIIKVGCLHAIRALEELHIIEVQFGDVLSEEDIIRLGYYWE